MVLLGYVNIGNFFPNLWSIVTVRQFWFNYIIKKKSSSTAHSPRILKDCHNIGQELHSGRPSSNCPSSINFESVLVAPA